MLVGADTSYMAYTANGLQTFYKRIPNEGPLSDEERAGLVKTLTAELAEKGLTPARGQDPVFEEEGEGDGKEWIVLLRCWPSTGRPLALE